MLARMPAHASITSSPSFVARRLQAERWRLALLGSCVGVLGVMWLVRRGVGGTVASSDEAFYGVLGVVVAALGVIARSYRDVQRRQRVGVALPYWPQVATLVFDLAVPFAVLAILGLYSPRGSFAALSGPSLMLVPIVIMLSVLKLRPLHSLLAGAGAAALHWALAYRAIVVDDVEPARYPVAFAYGTYLLLTGVGAATLAHIVRKYIEEAVQEADTAHRASAKLAAVEGELEIARTIQLGLLPSAPPDLPGFDIAGRAEPASQAGGDYFDWQALADGRLVVGVADVTGHGVGPALVMAVCRAYARATAPRSTGPADLLSRLNDLIVTDVRGGRFITMALAVVRESGSIDLLSAGHGPSFLYRAARAGAAAHVEHFGGDGLPLGVLDGESYAPVRQLEMEHGDVLVLITDGFMEQLGPEKGQFGIERLAATIQGHAHEPSERIVAALFGAVREFAGATPQNDDMTVVVIKRGK
jgi:serine phosphatase RsbU (regulator of sigma subunit)